jgi:hypothetical protein
MRRIGFSAPSASACQPIIERMDFWRRAGSMHSLAFGEPLAQYGIDHRLDKSWGDLVARSMPFATIDEARGFDAI